MGKRGIAFALCVSLAMWGLTGTAHAQNAPVRVALDAEFSNATSTADDAIKAGMEIAIDEINAAGGVLGGRPLQLEVRDNHGIPARGVRNLRELAAVPEMTAVFASKFSPVVLAQIDDAHELQIPILAPWSAADAIIDNGRQPNFIFRLSMRDSWAIARLLDSARQRGFNRIGLMVPNGAWGRSTLQAADAYAADRSTPTIARTISYEWADSSFANEYQELLDARVDAIVLVGNESEGARLIEAMRAQPKERWKPILAHWGVASGDLLRLAGPALFELDFTVVQTFSFAESRSPKAPRVLAEAQRRLGLPADAMPPSANGLAHAYDLMHLIARAIDKAGSTDRSRIRDALEQLDRQDGLVKSYAPPFTPQRHEALAADDLFMARWRKDGALIRTAP